MVKSRDNARCDQSRQAKVKSYLEVKSGTWEVKNFQRNRGID
jgi:hypothetical protein